MNARVLALALLALAGLCCSDQGIGQPGGGDAAAPDSRATRDLLRQTDLVARPDRVASGTLLAPVTVQGSSCSAAWTDTGSALPGKVCRVIPQALQLGVGAGAEPQRYGCRAGASGKTVEALLYEADCDDKSKISLSCGGLCDAPGLTGGSVEITGAKGCNMGWKDTGKNLGAGRRCQAFVGRLSLGVGAGAEPHAFGCRYDANTGALQAMLYELGCDDAAKISLRCDWLCAAGTKARAGVIKLQGKTHCQQGTQFVGPALGAGGLCLAGISHMTLGVGSGPEPNLYGCSYNPVSGRMVASLHEIGCDDKGINLQCGYLCSP